MTKTRILIPAVVTAALLVSGCGSSYGGSKSKASSGSSGGGYGSKPASTSASPAAAAAGATTSVKLQNISFAPNKITAKVGQTITWTNEDNVNHNVTATGGASFHSSNIGHGQTFTTKLTKPGTISYMCTIHPGMSGTIVVTS